MLFFTLLSRSDVGLSYLQDRTEESILSRDKDVHKPENAYVLQRINTQTQRQAQALLKTKNPNPLLGYPDTHVLQRAYTEISSVRNKGKSVNCTVVEKADRDSKSFSAMKAKEDLLLTDKSKPFFVCISMFFDPSLLVQSRLLFHVLDERVRYALFSQTAAGILHSSTKKI